mgnify:CR=1 FL=1
MKNLKDLGEKVAIQCKTQEEWDYLVETYDLNCVRHDIDLNIHFIDPSNGTYTLDYVKRNNYTILQASDFMPLSPQDEIKELKERIATLEETFRPKKKIEFVKYLNSNMVVESDPSSPESWVNIKVLCSYNGYDIMKAWKDDETDAHIYLGHFNDGEK